MNIEKFNLVAVEEILKGRISKNPNRFEEANGIVFAVTEMDFETDEYFSVRGVEFYELEEGIFYTETIMSIGEFSNLTPILSYNRVA